MSVRKIYQNFLRALGNLLLTGLMSFLCSSLKINEKNKKDLEKLLKEKKNVVLAFWHGTMIVPWYINRNKNFAALISTSKDGRLLTKLLTHWKYKVVGGSSHRNGKEALENLIELSKEGFNVSITPDGPTGPEFEMKPGAVVAAKKSGAPLFLLGAGYEKFRQFKSWDKFQLPKLFSRVNLVYSGPFYINNMLSYDETTQLIEKFQKKMNDLQREAQNFD